MKTTVLFLFGLILIVCKSSGQGNDSAIRKNYRVSLERLLENNAMNDVKKIEFSIPVSKEEALIYFSSVEKIAKGQKDLLCRTLSKADKNKIKRLNEIIAKYCHQ